MNERIKNLRERIANRITPANRNYVRKNLDITAQIVEILEQKGISQKELASRMGKTESEVSRYLTGLHNLTLRTLTHIETALDADVIITPIQAEQRYCTFATSTQYVFDVDHLWPKNFYQCRFDLPVAKALYAPMGDFLSSLEPEESIQATDVDFDSEVDHALAA